MPEHTTTAPSPTMYDGRPCKNCGGTLRRCCNRNCVVCDRQRKRDKYANDPEWAERERERDREWYFVRGWKVKRVRALAGQRERLVSELQALGSTLR